MKKILTTGLMLAMVLTLVSGLFPTTSVSAATTGDLIKVASSNAVYYLGADSKRYIFPNQATYMTWYSDFSGVKTISQSEIEGLTIGGNVTFRSGTKLIKFPTVPKVYAVEPGGVLRHITSETIATQLYGAEWYKMVGQVPEENYIAYTLGSDITTAEYPTGTLVKEEGGSTTYYIDGSEKRPVADEAAFNANNFQWDFVLTAASLSGYTAGASITGEESEISRIDMLSSGTETPVSTGTLSVSLASDTPASASVVKNATYVNFTKVNLTATGGDVTVDSMRIKRTGLTLDSYFSEVYLVDAATGSLHGTEKTLNSNHEAIVTKDIVIPNGTTKSFYLAATMSSSTFAASSASLSLTEVNLKGSAVVSASLPIVGNEMTLNSAVVIGTVTQSAAGTNPSANTSKRVGETNVLLAATNINAATEDMQVEMITFNNVGTASTGDFGNTKLSVDGVTLATVAQMDSDSNLVFNLSSAPYTISKGSTKTFEVRGDILDGSVRTIQLDHQKKTAIKAKGKTYGFYVAPTYATGTTEPVWNNPGYITISAGSLAASKATLTSTSIVEDADSQEIGAFYMRATGEVVNVTAMQIKVATTTTANNGLLDDITIYDENGYSVAGPVALASGATSTSLISFSDTFSVPTGLHKYTIKGDLDANWDANDTILLTFESITAKGETSNQAVTASGSTVPLQTVTVKVADLNVSTSSSVPAAQDVAAGTSNWHFADFVLSATESGEAVKVTRLNIKHTASADTHGDIGNVSLYNGSTLLNTPVSCDVTSGTTLIATTTIDLINPLVIPAGGTVTLSLKADISGSATTGDDHQFGLNGSDGVVSYGNVSGNEITEDYTASDGNIMNVVAGGTLRMANSGSNPAIGLILGNTTNEVGVFSVESLYEPINVTSLGFTIAQYDDISKLELWNGSTLVGEVPVTGAQATITPSALQINGNVELRLKAVTRAIDTNNPDAGAALLVTLTGIEANGASTGSQTSSLTISGLDATGSNYQYIYKTKPTVTNVALSGMSDNTEASLYKFTITADSKGEVGFAKATFKVSTTGVDVTDLKLYEDGVDITDTAITATVAESDAATTYDIFNVLLETDANLGKEYVKIGAGDTKTYILKGNVSGFGTANDKITVEMLGDNAVVAAVKDLDTVDGYASDNFIWSDLFLGFSTTTATGANEWTNGYKVLATTSQQFTY